MRWKINPQPSRVPRRFHPEVRVPRRRTRAWRGASRRSGRRAACRRRRSSRAPSPATACRRRSLLEAPRIVLPFCSMAGGLTSPTSPGWFCAPARLEALPYEELSSLYIEPRREGGAVLAAADPRGETRRLRLADEGRRGRAGDAGRRRSAARARRWATPRLPQVAGRPDGAGRGDRGAAGVRVGRRGPRRSSPVIRPTTPLLAADGGRPVHDRGAPRPPSVDAMAGRRACC